MRCDSNHPQRQPIPEPTKKPEPQFTLCWCADKVLCFLLILFALTLGLILGAVFAATILSALTALIVLGVLLLVLIIIVLIIKRCKCCKKNPCD
jgi:membrane protein YdbS with pleckstrin-like domain